MTTFFERLREERKRLGLNQAEMAGIAGVGRQAQVSYENGERSPNADYLQAIAAAGVDVQYLVTSIRSQEAAEAEPPRNYVDLNKKRIDSLMDDLTAQQQAELIKLAEEKKRLNQCEIELEEFKKKAK